MIISTKGRYALKLMMYLAQHADGSFIPLKIISTEVNVSLKYLERITTALSKQHWWNQPAEKAAAIGSPESRRRIVSGKF